MAPRLVSAQAAGVIPPSITTPDKVESRIGTLDFKDGAPSRATLDKVYEHVDFTHAFETFVNTMSGVSIHAIRKGLLSAGVKDNEVVVFSELMDAKSLFLTANADTVYAFGVLDLTKGPMVLEVPPQVPRRDRRLLVPLGHRHRSARRRPRGRREIFDPASGL
jgi:hypothetical protein